MKHLDNFIILIVTAVCITVLPTLAASATSWVVRIIASFLTIVLIGRPVFFHIQKFVNHDRY